MEGKEKERLVRISVLEKEFRLLKCNISSFRKLMDTRVSLQQIKTDLEHLLSMW